jgi:hypothetical protein
MLPGDVHACGRLARDGGSPERADLLILKTHGKGGFLDMRLKFR